MVTPSREKYCKWFLQFFLETRSVEIALKYYFCSTLYLSGRRRYRLGTRGGSGTLLIARGYRIIDTIFCYCQLKYLFYQVYAIAEQNYFLLLVTYLRNMWYYTDIGRYHALALWFLWIKFWYPQSHISTYIILWSQL